MRSLPFSFKESGLSISGTFGPYERKTGAGIFFSEFDFSCLGGKMVGLLVTDLLS
jgi:hypothetical protein